MLKMKIDGFMRKKEFKKFFVIYRVKRLIVFKIKTRRRARQRKQILAYLFALSKERGV